MPQKEIEIINKLGLHARAAAKLVTLASRFQCEIDIMRDEKKVNAKSIMGVMMLAAAKGCTVRVIAEGEDATEALAQIEALINDRFGEGQ